jgi:hypothetical protein
MRWIAVLACCAAPLRAADADAVRVVDDAIRAHGGSEKLTRARQVLRTGTGFLSPTGDNVTVSDELLVDLPGRFRHELRLGPQKQRVLIVLSGEQGWQVTGGMTQDLDPRRLAELRDDAHLLYLATLVPLRTDRDVTLTALPEATVQGRKALVVKAACKGHADTTLWFDRESGLLVRIARSDREYVFAEHSDQDGVKLPTKVVQKLAGRPLLTLSSVSYRFPRVREGSFARP